MEFMKNEQKKKIHLLQEIVQLLCNHYHENLEVHVDPKIPVMSFQVLFGPSKY